MMGLAATAGVATLSGAIASWELSRLGQARAPGRGPTTPPSAAAPPIGSKPAVVVAWTAEMSGPVSSLAVTSNLVITGTTANGGINATEVRQAVTGQMAWSTLGSGPYGTGPGAIYIGDASSNLFVFRDSAEETETWGLSVGGGPIASIAATSDAVCVSAGDGFLHVLDPRRRGSPLWTASADPGQLAADGQVVYLADRSGLVSAHRLSDGAQLWRQSVGVGSGAIAVASGIVYASGGGQVSALQTADGGELWAAPVNGPVTGIAVAGPAVYVGTSARWVQALDAVSGNVTWSYRASGPIAPGLAATAEAVYLGTVAQTVEAVTARGVPRWAVAVDGPVEAPIGVTGGLVFAGSSGGHVYALKA
jgi:outer membrane protein assembly factor BamB